MVAGIAVYNVEIFHLREPVLCGVSCEHARHTGGETAAEDGCEAGFLEALA